MARNKFDLILITVFLLVGVTLVVLLALNLSNDQEKTPEENAKQQTIPPQPPAPEQHELRLMVPPGWNEDEKNNALAAFKVFMQYHPVLFNNFVQDIDSVVMSKSILTKEQLEYDFRYKTYGWKAYYWIYVHINKNTRFIPDECVINGSTLHYTLGKGRRTGVELIKGIMPGTNCTLNGDNYLVEMDQLKDLKF